MTFVWRHSSGDTRLETLESLCEPAKQGLISEKIKAPLSLEKGNLEKLTTEKFIEEKDLNLLLPKCKKGIQEAIALFAFLEKKSDVSYAAVFTPLLGSIDEAAKAFIISTLKSTIPETPRNESASLSRTSPSFIPATRASTRGK
jgi:type III restriction enzyme